MVCEQDRGADEYGNFEYDIKHVCNLSVRMSVFSTQVHATGAARRGGRLTRLEIADRLGYATASGCMNPEEGPCASKLPELLASVRLGTARPALDCWCGSLSSSAALECAAGPG